MKMEKTGIKVGDVVFAKMKGWNFWPSVVEEVLSTKPLLVVVRWVGNHERETVEESQVEKNTWDNIARFGELKKVNGVHRSKLSRKKLVAKFEKAVETARKQLREEPQEQVNYENVAHSSTVQTPHETHYVESEDNQVDDVLENLEVTLGNEHPTINHPSPQNFSKVSSENYVSVQEIQTDCSDDEDRFGTIGDFKPRSVVEEESASEEVAGAAVQNSLAVFSPRYERRLNIRKMHQVIETTIRAIPRTTLNPYTLGLTKPGSFTIDPLGDSSFLLDDHSVTEYSNSPPSINNACETNDGSVVSKDSEKYSVHNDEHADKLRVQGIDTGNRMAIEHSRELIDNHGCYTARKNAHLQENIGSRKEDSSESKEKTQENQVGKVSVTASDGFETGYRISSINLVTKGTQVLPPDDLPQSAANRICRTAKPECTPPKATEQVNVSSAGAESSLTGSVTPEQRAARSASVEYINVPLQQNQLTTKVQGGLIGDDLAARIKQLVELKKGGVSFEDLKLLLQLNAGIANCAAGPEASDCLSVERQEEAASPSRTILRTATSPLVHSFDPRVLTDHRGVDYLAGPNACNGYTSSTELSEPAGETPFGDEGTVSPPVAHPNERMASSCSSRCVAEASSLDTRISMQNETRIRLNTEKINDAGVLTQTTGELATQSSPTDTGKQIAGCSTSLTSGFNPSNRMLLVDKLTGVYKGELNLVVTNHSGLISKPTEQLSGDSTEPNLAGPRTGSLPCVRAVDGVWTCPKCGVQKNSKGAWYYHWISRHA